MFADSNWVLENGPLDSFGAGRSSQGSFVSIEIVRINARDQVGDREVEVLNSSVFVTLFVHINFHKARKIYLSVGLPSKSSGKLAHGVVGLVAVSDLDHEAENGKAVAKAKTSAEVDVGSEVDKVDFGESVVPVDGVLGATLAGLVTPVEVEGVELS